MGRIDGSSCCICALLVALASMLGVDHVSAQGADSASGAPLRVNLSTIRSFDPPPTPGPGIRVRYDAFEEEFARDFGLRPGALDIGNGSQNFFHRLHGRLKTQWGDTSVYGWIQRGVTLYTQFEAMTSAERGGFDMSLDVDDVNEGRVGLQMSRELD